ncbi:AraC family transcriptional regulator [Caballeronia sp. GAFFF1]|uniref:helix-turn-helix domain-containing protein n=1 Tax=Caballeronia sp. GAFFF1 TaxID=2921779 RepID=UPI00202936B7|nr:AraC family transcriptional regulator [Caballeronia sp. GAFFF1]
MNPQGAYGDTMAERFHMKRADGFSIVNMTGDASFAVTRVSSDSRGTGRTQPIPVERALVLVLLLRPLIKHKLWLDDREIPVEPWAAGTLSVVDLEQSPSAYIGGSMDALHFYLPRTSLESVAASSGTKTITELRIAEGISDPIVRELGQMMLPAMRKPEQANNLYTSGLMTALYAHIQQTYAGYSYGSRLEQGGLGPRQLARAKELIASNLDGNISLNQLAAMCDVSPAHFARAFKRSTGVAPHRWLLMHRVETAKQLLSRADLNGAEIATACGFADQSHMIRVFSNIAGVTPKAWQKEHTNA